jgi:hypothetical protein
MMKKIIKLGAIILVAASPPVLAQSPKELKTKPGVSVVLVNLITARPDCSATPGPSALPVVTAPPVNGIVQLQIIVSDVPAGNNCPARKIPSTALIYTPNKDFSGSDKVEIDIVTGNQKRSFGYQITVQNPGQQL